MKIAIVGTGVAGIGAAWLLSQEHEVVMYEKDDYIGGHTHTIDVPVSPHSKQTTPVDTGFIVFNRNTYPNMLNFFGHLGVKFQNSDMSFSVSQDQGQLEWAGENLSTVFAQWSNVFSPSFLRMLYDMYRFNNDGPKFLLRTDARAMTITLGEYLAENGYSDAFRDLYILPMSSSIWSTPAKEMMQFPMVTLFRFYHNHGFMQIYDRPQWLTVTNGRRVSPWLDKRCARGVGLLSREYVHRALAKVRDIRLRTPVVAVRRTEVGKVIVRDHTQREESFDHVIFACHGDQTYRLLADRTPEETAILSCIRYKDNRAIVHRDPRLMPKLRSTWSSWNYLSSTKAGKQEVCLTYWMNRLQPFMPQKEENQLFVTLNPLYEPRRELVLAEFNYEHPVYTGEAIGAQKRLKEIQGVNRTWFCGAWTNFGFHEDGLTSGLRVAEQLGAKCPFPVVDATHIRPVNSKL